LQGLEIRRAGRHRDVRRVPVHSSESVLEVFGELS
jgi:hypothetical protein